MYPYIKPFDIIVLQGRWYKPSEAVVMWRSISKYCHCVFAIDSNTIYDPNLDGLKKQSMAEYNGRYVTVCRIKDQDKLEKQKAMMTKWAEDKFYNAEGYDYLAWFGFATGIKAFKSEDRWFCSEMPYWCFMDNGFKLSNKPLNFMYPSFFVDNAGMFEIAYEGVLKWQ